MTPDDQANQRDLERERLLEEIRKRAEEEELKRIEEEEKAAVPTPKSPPKPAKETRIKELRDKLSIALDRGRLDKAVELYEELQVAAPDDIELDDFRIRIERLREDLQQQQKAKKRAAELKQKEEAAQERAKREAQQRKIAELLEKANSLYQQEKYDRGLAAVREILAMDEGNEDALKLSENIEKAKHLYEQIKAEEARRKEEEGRGAPPPLPAEPAVPQTEDEVWGRGNQPKEKTEFEVPEDEGPPPPPKLERAVERLSRVRIPVKAILIIVGIGVLGIAGYIIVNRIQDAVFPAKYSLLILPARGPGGDTSLANIADGITEVLIHDVSTLSELRVFSPVTSFALSRSGASSIQLGKSIGANFVVQWDVARTGEDFVISVGLLDTLSSSPVWSTNTQTSSRELCSVVLELGKGLAAAMQVPLTPQEEKYLSTVSEVSPRAFEAYARGISLLRRSRGRSVEEASLSFAYAAQLDPGFARAHAALAWTELMRYEQETNPSPALLSSAEVHLKDAVASGTPTSEMFRGRAMAAVFHSEFDRAAEELERAIAAAPSDAEAHRRMSVLYTIRGKGDDAVKSATRAVSDDPRNVDSYTILAMALQYRAMVFQLNGKDQEVRYDLRRALSNYEAGLLLASDRSEYMAGLYSDLLHATQQTERAIQVLSDRVAELREDYVENYKLGRLYQAAGYPKGQWESVFERARSLLVGRLALQPDDAQALSYLGLVLSRLGQFREAAEEGLRAQSIAPSDPDVLYNVARMFTLHRDKARALESLKNAVDLRYKPASILDMDFYSLRTEPDFYTAITR